MPSATTPAPDATLPTAVAGLPQRRLRALGTEVVVIGQRAEAAAAELQRLEALLTRFRPSPLTTLNAEGRLSPAPPELIEALRHALAVASDTGGLITPLILPALRWAGYRNAWPAPAEPQPGDPPATADWREVRLDDAAIHLPEGAAVDLGGTAKSWIAVRCLQQLLGEALIDAGGDVISRSPETAAIDVARPRGGEPLQVLLPPGTWGVATSGVLARSWRGGHHLIDPRTGRPAQTRFVQVTAIHPDLRRAEVLAKLALLAPLAPALTGASVLIAFDASGGVWRLGDDGVWGQA
ncbi:MAG TPA: FAD:protein FMN transferase [Trueperaceae bacterium]|nr:FAD:protein FMN transferase [Trueperaceae bacterium]